MHILYSGKILWGSTFAHAMIDLYYFVGFIFADMFIHIHYVQYCAIEFISWV